MKITNIIFISVLFLSFFGCASPEKFMINQLNKRGKVLNQYEVDGELYAIVKEGNNINLYRLKRYKQLGINTGYSHLLYTIDSVTKECYKYINAQNIIEIECSKLQNDEHLKAYINE